MFKTNLGRKSEVRNPKFEGRGARRRTGIRAEEENQEYEHEYEYEYEQDSN